MKPRDFLVCSHGRCFDGLASAALFTHLARSIGGAAGGRGQSFRYKSCGYGPGMQTIPEGWLDGEENAILDFRYTASKRVGFYFDHHITAFGSPAERDQALAAHHDDGSRPQVHYDPTYGSCAKLIADRARERFGVDMSKHDELIRWADLIDSARFESAAAATSADEPVLQLAAVIEVHGDGPFYNAMAPRLLEEGLAAVCKSADVQAKWAPIRAQREAFLERVRETAEVEGRVVVADLSSAPADVGAKFVSYALYPETAYSVTLTRAKQHFKISVGHNPWSGQARTHDISAICKRFGGGGHPAVGAFAYPLTQLEEARAALVTVTRELNGGAPAEKDEP